MRLNVATIKEVKNPKMRLWIGLYEMLVRTKTAVYTIDVTTAERTMESSIAFSVDYLKRNFSNVNIKLVSNKEYRKRG
jgi:hypothetical protein